MIRFGKEDEEEVAAGAAVGWHCWSSINNANADDVWKLYEGYSFINSC